ADRQLAETAGILDYVRDRIRRIHDQIEDHLVDLAQMTLHGGQLTELRVELGDIFVLVAGDDERAANRLIQIDEAFFRLVRMRELLHGANDGRDPAQALDRAVDRGRRILQDI